MEESKPCLKISDILYKCLKANNINRAKAPIAIFKDIKICFMNGLYLIYKIWTIELFKVSFSNDKI